MSDSCRKVVLLGEPAERHCHNIYAACLYAEELSPDIYALLLRRSDAIEDGYLDISTICPPAPLKIFFIIAAILLRHCHYRRHYHASPFPCH